MKFRWDSCGVSKGRLWGSIGFHMGFLWGFYGVSLGTLSGFDGILYLLIFYGMSMRLLPDLRKDVYGS